MILTRLSLADVFRLGEVKAYLLEADVVLTVRRDGKEALLHLHENAHGALCIWPLMVSREWTTQSQPAFEGKIVSLEITFAGDEHLWDFRSMSLVNEGSEVRIERCDASFPEPTLRFAGDESKRGKQSI